MQADELRTHSDTQLRVEIREGLVHEERLRLPHDRAAHRHALPLAARQLGRPASEQVLEAEESCNLGDSARGFGLLRAADLEAVAEVLADRHVRIEGVALEDHRDVPVARSPVRDLASSDGEPTVRGLLEACNQPEERRLPAAGGTDQDEELAVLDRERHVVDRDDAASECLRHMLEDDLSQRRRAPSLRRRPRESRGDRRG